MSASDKAPTQAVRQWLDCAKHIKNQYLKKQRDVRQQRIHAMRVQQAIIRRQCDYMALQIEQLEQCLPQVDDNDTHEQKQQSLVELEEDRKQWLHDTHMAMNRALFQLVVNDEIWVRDESSALSNFNSDYDQQPCRVFRLTKVTELVFADPTRIGSKALLKYRVPIDVVKSFITCAWDQDYSDMSKNNKPYDILPRLPHEEQLVYQTLAAIRHERWVFLQPSVTNQE